MRLVVAAALAATFLPGACSGTPAAEGGAPHADPSARYSLWRPSPILEAKEPSDILRDSQPADWRPVDAQNLLVMELVNGAQVAIELAPEFAPVHVANIRALARGGWWNPASVYRVQENYVVQWGLNESDKPFPKGVVKLPPAEYERPLAELDVRPLGFPDSYAPMAGHSDGWPIGYDAQSGRAWLAHCYAMVGVGRDLHPDTGSGGELYAVIGHAPPQLDKNIALVGRVLEGLDRLSAHPRGTEALGFIKEEKDQIPIRRIALAADMPAASRPAFEVMRTDTAAFDAYVTGRANRSGQFFRVPAGGVDLCNVNVPIRRRLKHPR